jgi:hypothetical protein
MEATLFTASTKQQTAMYVCGHLYHTGLNPMAQSIWEDRYQNPEAYERAVYYISKSEHFYWCERREEWLNLTPLALLFPHEIQEFLDTLSGEDSSTATLIK